MTFLACRPFRQRKHKNDVIVTSYIKICQILKFKSKDHTKQTLYAIFYASRVKNKRFLRVFKSPVRIDLNGSKTYKC